MILAEVALECLLRDYGYEVRAGRLIRSGMRGLTSEQEIVRVRSVLDAAEYLCPVVAEPEFTSRLRLIEQG